MKRYLIYIMSVLAALSVLTACDREELRDDVLGESLSVRLGIDTRAGLSASSQIGDFGLFIYGYANVRMSTTDHTTWSPSTTILWAQLPATYWAYYPYDESVAQSGGYTSVGWSVKTDQRADADVEASDLLAASATVNSRPTGGVLPIELKHTMSKIIINLTLSGDIAGGTVSDVSLGESYTSGILYLHDGTYGDCKMVVDNASGAAKGKIAMNASAGTYEAVVIPQEFAPSVTFSVSVAGNDYDYRWTPSAMTFAQGKRYTVSMTADRSTLSVVGINVSDWETGGDLTGNTTTTTEPSRKAIRTLDELIAFRTAVNAGTVAETDEYYLANDITVTENWGTTGVGTSSNPFNGILDGNGKTITVTRAISYTSGTTTYYHGGVFDYVGVTGKVYDLTVAGSVSQTYTGNVNGTKTAYTGGIVGRNYGTVEGCIYNGTVTTSVDNTYSNNNANAYSYSGGIAGYNGGIIQVCGVSGTGNIAANATARNNNRNSGYARACSGGIAGYNYSGSSILACYNQSNVAAAKSGGRNGSNSYRGGIVGNNGGTVNRGYFYYRNNDINVDYYYAIGVAGTGNSTSNSGSFTSASSQFNSDTNINYMNNATVNSLYKWVRRTSSPYYPTISKK